MTIDDREEALPEFATNEPSHHQGITTIEGKSDTDVRSEKPGAEVTLNFRGQSGDIESIMTESETDKSQGDRRHSQRLMNRGKRRKADEEEEKLKSEEREIESKEDDKIKSEKITPREREKKSKEEAEAENDKKEAKKKYHQ